MKKRRTCRVIVALALSVVIATSMISPVSGATHLEAPEVTKNQNYRWLFTPAEGNASRTLLAGYTPATYSDAPSELSPVLQEFRFDDVTPDAWYYSAVMYVYDEDIMEGFPDDTFGPDSALNRAQVVTILYRLAGSPDVTGLENPFADVAADQWWTPQILWAYSEGVTTGFVEGGVRTFRGAQNVTMEELSAFVARDQEATGEIPMPILADFVWPDFEDVRPFAKEYVGRLTSQGLFRDMPGNTFGPQEDASRATVALVLYNWLERARG